MPRTLLRTSPSRDAGRFAERAPARRQETEQSWDDARYFRGIGAARPDAGPRCDTCDVRLGRTPNRRQSTRLAKSACDGKPGGRGAGRKAAGVTGCDISGWGSLRERLRGVRRPDQQGAGRLGGKLEMTHRAVMIGCVLLVPDNRGGCGTGQRDHQDGGPGARAKAASCESCPRAQSLDHDHWPALPGSAAGSRIVLDGILIQLRLNLKHGGSDAGRRATGRSVSGDPTRRSTRTGSPPAGPASSCRPAWLPAGPPPAPRRVRR